MRDQIAALALERLATAKRRLRETVGCRTLSAAEVEQESRRIADTVRALPEFRDAAGVGLYLSMANEPATDTLLSACHDLGKTVCVPASLSGDSGYAMAHFKRDTLLAPGRFGVSEPVTPAWAEPGDIDLMILPGVAFDPRGNRIGHGKGYYDRLLSRYGAPRIGLALSVQCVDDVPHGRWDLPMDMVVTAAQVWRSTPENASNNL